jgi:hypothetical protein
MVIDDAGWARGLQAQQTDGHPAHHRTCQPELVVQAAVDVEEHRDRERRT